MKKKVLIQIILFAFSITLCYAQSEEDPIVTVSMSKWKAMENDVKKLNDSIITLNLVIENKDSTIAKKELSYKDIFGKLTNANQSITNLQKQILSMKSDSISKDKDLGDIRSQLLTAQKQLGRIDTMTIQMIITYMNLRCSEKRIGTLRNDFKGISSPEIKNQYKQWDTLLSLYTETYNGVRNAIQEASGKIPNAAMPALRDRYISETEQRIASLQYIKQFLADKNCTSSYLNNMISDARALLTATSQDKDFQVFLRLHP